MVRMHQDSTSSHGEGPSRPKGKGPDALNWGNVGIDPKELDPKEQNLLLEYFKALKQKKTAVPKGKLKRTLPTKDPNAGESPASSGDESR